METVSGEQPRPRHGSRTALVLALALALVGTVVVVRGGDERAATAADLRRLADSVEQGCAEASSDLAGTTGFAFDGTVVAVTRPADPGAPVVVGMQVAEWFRGPPLDVVDVRLAPRTVRFLEGTGERFAPGARLLVSGSGWGTGSQPPAAAGCGRTRPHDVATADDWRDRLTPAPVAPDGPLARYPDAGWRMRNTEGTPGVSGVLLHDDGCVYVAEGLIRWVPVFPASSATWDGSVPGVQIGGHPVDVGHPVRLVGEPATGDWLSAAVRAETTGPGPVRLDRTGLPPGCRDDVPVLVVADTAEDPPGTAVPLADDDPIVEAARAGATRAGLQPGAVTAELRRDPFGVVSVRAVVPTARAGELLVHVESVSFVAWPHAYVASDSSLLWSEDPEDADLLPQVAPQTELAVVGRADGATQLLLRARPPVVVSVTAGPRTTVPGTAVPGTTGERLTGRALLAALTAVAEDVAHARELTPQP